MDSALTTVLLPLALALVMFGLGLSLTIGDFARVGRQPKAVVIALVLQLLVLPGDLLRPGAGLRPAAAAGGRPAAAGGLAGRHDGQPVQPPVPRGRGAEHHADRGELADRRGDPAGDHEPRHRLLRPGRRRQPRPAVRQDAAGVRDRARAGRPRAWWSGSGRPRSPTGWTGPCGSLSAVVLALVIVGTIIAERENISGYVARRRPARAAVLPGQPDPRVRRPAGARRGPAAGDRQRVRDRHAQRHAGDRHRDQRAGQRRARRPGRRLQRDHVPRGRACSAGPITRSVGAREAEEAPAGA